MCMANAWVKSCPTKEKKNQIIIAIIGTRMQSLSLWVWMMFADF